MQRAILLQTIPTKSKAVILKDFSQKAITLANSLLSQRTSKRLMELHKATYSASKEATSFNSQVICDIERCVVRAKGDSLKRITVKFNIPRNCKTFSTKANFFVELGIYPRNRIAVPIKRNRDYQRFTDLVKNGWICKTFGLTSDLQVVAYLSKEQEIPERKNALGIDINAKHFAVSVVSPNGKILYQTYFGKHIWARRKKIMERRALLQSLNATKKLKKLGEYEKNFVKTNLGQIIKEIIRIAIRFDADISIEDLKRFGKLGRKANKTIMRIPFYQFKKILGQRCFDNQIHLNIMDSWHTSKWCTHCGAVGAGHSATYSIFKCKNCGQVVNADRKASVAIAVKSLLVREHSSDRTGFFQLTSRQVPVSGLMQSDDVGLVDVVHLSHPIQESLAS